MAIKWTKKQDEKDKKQQDTAEFKDFFFVENMFKSREKAPVEIKTEGKKK